MSVSTSSQVMLRRIGTTDRKVIDVDISQNRPPYGQDLTLQIDGKDVHAKVVAFWKPPKSPFGIYMINADEIE